MEKCIQFSVFLVNKPGVMTQVFAELGKAKANVAALAMMDSTEHGVLRVVVDDPDAAREVFRDLELHFTESEVLRVVLPNRPGAAADLCEKLAAKHVNIAYMYCTGGAKGGKTFVIFKVSDIKKAMKVLDGTNSRVDKRDMKIKLRRPAGTRRR